MTFMEYLRALSTQARAIRDDLRAKKASPDLAGPQYAQQRAMCDALANIYDQISWQIDGRGTWHPAGEPNPGDPASVGLNRSCMLATLQGRPDPEMDGV